MSGHSKWSTIKHKKAATDAKRAKLFTKVARAITVVARQGGGDPETNPALRRAVAEARDINMPNDNIERAIARGTGEGDDTVLEELTVEAYGPEGAAIMIDAITDNRNRTLSAIKHTLAQHGAKFAERGSVAWAFERKGEEMVAKTPFSISDDGKNKLQRLFEALDENDDVQDIYTNVELPEEEE